MDNDNTSMSSEDNDTINNENLNVRMEDDKIVEPTQNTMYNPIKRLREEEEEDDEDGEWTVCKRKEKKFKEDGNILQYYIFNREKMPKQFALAKLFKECEISDITRVKYISPYKVRIDMANEASAMKLESCQKFTDKGWKIQRAMEINTSYGVIRDVDLEITEEEILKTISYPSPAKLLGVKRLTRRNSDKEGWSDCESVRLAFVGSFLPAYICVDGLRIKVEPFVFPVRQCSRCWKFGHTARFCPSTKTVCPKCTGNHENCERSSFICANCADNHMSLDRSCPVFIKEKKIRQIMADFNCTYQKALAIYVPPTSPAPPQNDIKFNQEISEPCIELIQEAITPENKCNTYASIIGTKPKSKRAQHNKKKNSSTPHNTSFKSEFNDIESEPSDIPDEVPAPKRNVDFAELLSRIKDILFYRRNSIPEKIRSIIKCCMEWLILVLVDNISEWPVLEKILKFVNG